MIHPSASDSRQGDLTSDHAPAVSHPPQGQVEVNSPLYGWSEAVSVSTPFQQWLQVRQGFSPVAVHTVTLDKQSPEIPP